MSAGASSDQTAKAYAAGVGFTLIFCLHYLAAAKLLEDLPATVLGSARGLGAGLLLVAVFPRQLRPLFAPGRRVPMLCVGLSGFCLNQLLLLEGLKRSTPADAALITNCIPLVSTVLAIFLRKEMPSRRQWFGLVLGFGALTGYFAWQGQASPDSHLLGNLLIFANVVSLCFALVLIKKLVTEASEIAVTAAMLTIGGAVLGVFAGPTLWTALAPVFADAGKVALLAFEVFVVSIGGYFLNVYALKRLPVAAVMSTAYLQPPLTAGLAFLILGRSVDAALLPLFLAVVLATWLGRPTPG